MSPYDPAKHHRRSIRLQGHDYAGGGLYFITICAHRDAGKIFADESAKEILSQIWQEILMEAGGEEGRMEEGRAKEGRMEEGRAKEGRAKEGRMEEGRAKEGRAKEGRAKEGRMEEGRAKEGRTQGAPVRAGLVSALPPAEKEGAHEARYIIMPDHFHGLIRIRKGEKALGDFICAFKSRTTLEYIQGVKAGNFPRFKGKIWHRNYYEMIVRSAAAEEKISEYIQMNPWRCVQQFANGLRGMGNPALWNGPKTGVLCSRNAPPIPPIPAAAAYFSGFHSPMEKKIFKKLLEAKRPLIWCPAWGLDRAAADPAVRQALEENRMLVLEMKNAEGDLAAAEARNRFVIEKSDTLWTPHVNPGGMLARLLNVKEKV